MGPGRISRRNFLRSGLVVAASLAACEAGAPPPSSDRRPSPPASPGEEAVLSLPAGFRQRVISQEGESLPGGLEVAGNHDGMTAIPYKGATLLVRNHELLPSESTIVQGRNPFDAGDAGGVTGVLVSPQRDNLREVTLSSGTRRNCAGGRTPWDTWLTCEEILEEGHGWVFEIPPQEPESDLTRTPIRGMGLFRHEAVGVDPGTGIVYLTEDAPPQSFVYRYIPEDRSRRPGALQRGGRLQAMRIEEGNPPGDPGSVVRVGWIDVDPEQAPAQAAERGAVAFQKLEGAFFEDGVFWFPDTSGGQDDLGQIFRYSPAEERLELFFESTEEDDMEAPDNLVMTPWGDLWFVEDGGGVDRVMGITPEGEAYEFARNELNDSELSGPCFSPDGTTFFVNVYDPGMTLAVWGPFDPWSRERRMSMSRAAPPRGAVAISEELHEAALRNGLGDLEAAAYRTLGVPL